MIYLDYAAATPLDPDVVRAMQPYQVQKFFNPSADYRSARVIKNDLFLARSGVAQIIGAKPSEVIFTAGGTEANNLALKGVMELHPGANLLTSSIEHDSVLAPAANYHHKELAVAKDGRVLTAELKDKIDDQTVLVSIIYANNEIGAIQPLRQIGQIINEVRRERKTRGIALPLYFHSDGCQAGNYLDLHVSRLGLDMLTLNGGKIYGPKQSGALFVRAGTTLKPQIEGGGQEYGLRSGTENVAQIIGFAAALAKAQQLKDAESKRLSKLRDYFIEQIETTLSTARVNGSKQFRLANNVHATFLGADNETLLIKLDQKNIMAAAGSACSASSREASHVLLSLGLSESEARSSLRFSLGRATTKKDIDKVVLALKDILR